MTLKYTIEDPYINKQSMTIIHLEYPCIQMLSVFVSIYATKSLYCSFHKLRGSTKMLGFPIPGISPWWFLFPLFGAPKSFEGKVEHMDTLETGLAPEQKILIAGEQRIRISGSAFAPFAAHLIALQEGSDDLIVFFLGELSKVGEQELEAQIGPATNALCASQRKDLLHECCLPTGALFQTLSRKPILIKHTLLTFDHQHLSTSADGVVETVETILPARGEEQRARSFFEQGWSGVNREVQALDAKEMRLHAFREQLQQTIDNRREIMVIALRKQRFPAIAAQQISQSSSALWRTQSREQLLDLFMREPEEKLSRCSALVERQEVGIAQEFIFQRVQQKNGRALFEGREQRRSQFRPIERQESTIFRQSNRIWWLDRNVHWLASVLFVVKDKPVESDRTDQTGEFLRRQRHWLERRQDRRGRRMRLTTRALAIGCCVDPRRSIAGSWLDRGT